MPVGRVFNAAQNQVLISPVSSYYEGKAKRASLAGAELDRERKQQEIDMAPDKLALEKERVALAKQQVANQEVAYDLAREKFEMAVGKEFASKAAFDVYSITQEVDASFQKGGKTQEAATASLELAKKRFTEYANSLPEGESKAKLLEVLEGGITVEEYQTILPVAERNAKYYGHIKDGKLTTVAKGADLVDAEGNVVYQNIDEVALAKARQGASGKKPTSAQGKAAGYAIRLADANKIFQELEDGGHDFTNFWVSKQSLAPNRWQTDAFQKFEQAKENFINAVLRPESGAAIAPSEFEKADSQYFPQPGDGEEVVKQKKANRIAKQAALEAEAGMAAIDLARERVDILTQENPDELRLQEMGF